MVKSRSLKPTAVCAIIILLNAPGHCILRKGVVSLSLKMVGCFEFNSSERGVNSSLASHHQRGHTKTGPRFKVSAQRQEKQGINLAIPGLVV